MTYPQVFHVVTLGCKVNQYESQALREAWIMRGMTETDDAASAGVVCVNTCAVTSKAVADGRAAVRRANRENPEAAIIVTGCAAQVFASEFVKLPGVTLVVPQAAKARLLQAGEEAFCHSSGRVYSPCEEAATAAYPPFFITSYDRSRAVLKVQDGCSHRCTYCIVPLTRGQSRSRPPGETLAEAKRLLAAGFRELVLNGINLAQYGRDFSEEHDFWDLVAYLERELAPEWAGRARIRLSSLEPGQLGSKALDVLGSSVMVAPHLHLSLQSGSREVLRRMGRGHYDPGSLPDFCRALAGIFPRFGLGADILSGFPGESEEEARATEALCSEMPFSYAHVFPYSRRPGTPASQWPGQVAEPVKKERAARLRAIFAAKKQRFLEWCAAQPHMHVACEEPETGRGKAVSGVNEYYVECRFADGDEPAPSQRRVLVPVTPAGLGDGWLWVEQDRAARL